MVDSHLLYQLKGSGIMYPYLLGKADSVACLRITCGVGFSGTSNFSIILIPWLVCFEHLNSYI